MEKYIDRPAELKRTKDEFRKAMLDNDTFFSLLLAHLESSHLKTDPALPIFQLEPTIQETEKLWTVGVQLSNSGKSSESEVTIGVEIFDYLSLGDLDTSTGIFTISEQLAALMTKMGLEKTDPGILSIIQTWYKGVRAIQASVPELFLDPGTGTLQLEPRVMEIGGMMVVGADDEQASLLKRREAFVNKYLAEKGWDHAALSVEQILEIRKQPDWQNPPELN